MRAITLTAEFVIALGMLSAAPMAHAPTLDLDSCHDDLDRLRRVAADASDAAEEGHSKSEEFEDCRRNSESPDDCSSRHSDYESALSDLESKMDDLDSRLRSVQSSCGYEFTINRMTALEASQRQLEASKRRLARSKQRLCTSIQNLVILGMTPDNALKMCRVSADEQSCKACLGLK